MCPPDRIVSLARAAEPSGWDGSTRGRRLDEQIGTLRLAFSGDGFDHYGENQERAIIGFADSVITPLREQVATPRADETTPTEQGGST